MRFAFSPKRLRRPTRRWHLEPLEPRLVLSACPGDQAQIAGSVWNDADRDGQWDQGEYAVFGIPLALTAADGTLIGTTTTGSSDAGILFTGLCPGQYHLRVGLPQGVEFSPAGSVPFDQTTRTASLSLAAGERLWLSIPVAATQPTASVEVVLWHDRDADGLRSAVEGPFDGASAQLLRVFVIDGKTEMESILTSWSGSDGVMRFDGASLLPGTYVVEVRLSNMYHPFAHPAGTLAISPRGRGEGLSGVIDSQLQPLTGRSAPFVLESGSSATVTRHAGIHVLSEIRGTVWHDVDGNVDGKFRDVDVKLLDAEGTVIAVTRTDSQGLYRFGPLRPGKVYAIEVVPPTGTVFGPAGINSWVDPLTGRVAPFLLQSQEVAQRDVALRTTGDAPSVAGVVWDDPDGDGIRNDAEQGLPGVSVHLVTAGGSIVASTLTDALGKYDFADVPVNDYRVLVDPPPGATFSPMRRGSDAARDSNFNRGTHQSETFSVRPGQVTSGVDAGIYRGPLSTDAAALLRVVEVAFVGHSYAEFIELRNVGDVPLDLTGVRFTAGVRFEFSTSSVRTLFPGELAVVAGSIQKLATRVDLEQILFAGVYRGDLNRFERLTLVDAQNNPVLDFSYSHRWSILFDSEVGVWSIVVNDDRAPAGTWGEAYQWRMGNRMGGTPGYEEWQPTIVPRVAAGVTAMPVVPLPPVSLEPRSIVINEIVAKPHDGFNDLIEIHNTTNHDINIGNWYLGDTGRGTGTTALEMLQQTRLAGLTRFQFPSNTIVPAQGYLLLNRLEHFGNLDNPGTLDPFGLSSFGEWLHLVAADEYGDLRAYSDSVNFLASDPGVAYGRHVKGNGDADFVRLRAPTIGGTNAAPNVGPIIVNEIMYYPAADGDEFIELWNISSDDVTLADALAAWRLDSAVRFEFPAGTTLPARSRMLVVPTDPAEFRAKYNLPSDVLVLGPYTGNLSNAGEAIDLVRKNLLDNREILVERVEYLTAGAWPSEAHGTGRSLERRRADAYGNDPFAWQASDPNGPTPGRLNSVVQFDFGDCNLDGLLDGLDVDCLRTAVRQTSEPYSQYHDLNADGRLDNADVDFLIRSTLNTAWGDLNVDGRVGLTDLIRLRNRLGSTEAGWDKGDLDGDGSVGGPDLAIVAANFGFDRYAPPRGDTDQPVEPPAPVLVAVLAAAPSADPLSTETSARVERAVDRVLRDSAWNNVRDAARRDLGDAAARHSAKRQELRSRAARPGPRHLDPPQRPSSDADANAPRSRPEA